jgi:hypothetical protein
MWPRDNIDSWQTTLQDIDEYPDDSYWSSYKATAQDVFSSLTKLELNQAFRVGQSMHDIIFSTLDHHGLRDEPRVTFTIMPKEGLVKIAYSYSHVDFGPSAPVSEEICPASDVTPALVNYLMRLWIETKPSERIPLGLS